MKVYVLVDTDTSARDSVYGVFASRELANEWIDSQPWINEDVRDFLIIIEDELKIE